MTCERTVDITWMITYNNIARLVGPLFEITKQGNMKVANQQRKESAHEKSISRA